MARRYLSPPVVTGDTVRWQSRTAVSKCARVLRELSAAAPQSRRKLIRPRWEKRAKEIAKGYPSSGLCR